MTTTDKAKLESLIKWKNELTDELAQVEKDIVTAQGKRYRAPEKAGRSRKARSNVSLDLIRANIAEVYGLPEDAIVFMAPCKTRSCKNITVGQLRTKWDWSANSPTNSKENT